MLFGNKRFYFVYFSGAIVFLMIAVFCYGYVYGEKKSDITINILQKSKRIISIQYEAISESFDGSGGRNISNTIVTYVYPDKLRVEINRGSKIIEIYNNDKYMYHDSITNKVKVKECFPPEGPYLTELEKKVEGILKNGNYEFFGYEEKGNSKFEVIGVKSRDDEHSYMHKLWITETNGVKLPAIEEYFIDGRVVSKVKYTFYKVNEPVNPDLFQMPLSSQTQIIEDGYLPKHVETFEEAQRYLNFPMQLPGKAPLDLIVSEIAVIPPVSKPSFSCIYFKDGYRIYLGERKEREDITSNSSLGEHRCKFYVVDEKVVIIWLQKDIYITLSGDVELVEDIIYLAESMSGGKLIRDDINN